MENTLKDRVKEFLEVSKISHADFARRADVTRAYVGNIKANLTVPVLECLKKINPSLSLDWLLLNQGPMFQPTAAQILALEAEQAKDFINEIRAEHTAQLEKLEKINTKLTAQIEELQHLNGTNRQVTNE